MFRITKNGASVGMTEAPTYIKQHSNGSFVLCPEPEASGIAFAGSVYHLLGREPLEGAESVMLEEVDAGTEITRANETNGIVFVTLAESGGIDAATAAEHADLFAEWAYPIKYKEGQIRRYGGALYKCVQEHTSQADWTPDSASSLWAGTSDPAEEWPTWSAPVDQRPGRQRVGTGRLWLDRGRGGAWRWSITAISPGGGPDSQVLAASW